MIYLNKNTKFSVIKDSDIGEGTTIHDQVNLYKCKIGKNCKVDAFVYIEEGVEIGDECKIRAFTFIPSGVKIGDRVFIGPNVTFTNDRYPTVSGDWEMEKTVIENEVSIGAGVTILPGIRIEKGSTVGAGSTVTEDIPPQTRVAGNPARKVEQKSH